MKLSLSVRHQQSLSAFEKCQKGTLRFDLYKQPFRLLLPDEKDMYRTLAGALLTIFSVVLVLVYAGYKVGILVSLSDYKIQVRTQERYFDMNERFDQNLGLMIGASIPSWGNFRTEIPANIGALKFYIKKWSPTEDIIFDEVETRPC